MKTILKKSLALAICVALCLTAFIGSLSVSAAGTATAVISTANVANGTASTNLTVTISGSPNIVGARFDIVADATKLTLGTPTISSGATLTETSTPADNTTRFILTADDLSTGLASVVVTLPYTIVNPSTAGTLDVTFGTLKEVAEVGETLMTVNPTNGSITVQAAHVHDFSGSWQSNANYHWKVCPADNETGNQAAHTFGAWSTTVQPGCTTTGTKVRSCTVCGYEESDTVAATGHNYEAVVTAPTCTAAGYTTHTCSVCGNSYTDTPVAALGHDWDEGEVTTAATCTADGVLTKHCTRCDATNTEVITATGHTAGAAADEDIVAPTCTAAGSHNSVVRCTVCNAIISSTPVVDAATGHTPAAAVQENVVAATCGAAGSYDSVVYCSVCNAELSRETVNVPATGEHTAAAAVQENVVAATCGAAGSYDSVVYCSVCNAKLSTTPEVIPATGEHNWGEYTSDADGHSRTCSVCGAVDAGAHVGDPCSVCGYEAPAVGPTVDNTIVFQSKSIGLASSSVQFSFRLQRALLDVYADFDMVLVPGKYDLSTFNEVEDPAEVVIHKSAFSTPGKVYSYSYTDIQLYELGLDIEYYIKCYDGEGNYVARSEYFTISPAESVKTLIENNKASKPLLATALTDLLVLSDVAANSFATEGSDLANAESVLIGVDTSIATASVDPASLEDVDSYTCYNDLFGTASSAVHRFATTVSVEKVPVLNYRIKNTVGAASELDTSKLVMTITYTSSDSSVHEKVVTGDDWVQSGSYLTFGYDQVGLHDAAATITAVATYDGEPIFTKVYSYNTHYKTRMGDANASQRLFTALAKLGHSFPLSM